MKQHEWCYDRFRVAKAYIYNISPFRTSNWFVPYKHQGQIIFEKVSILSSRGFLPSLDFLSCLVL